MTIQQQLKRNDKETKSIVEVPWVVRASTNRGNGKSRAGLVKAPRAN